MLQEEEEEEEEDHPHYTIEHSLPESRHDRILSQINQPKRVVTGTTQEKLSVYQGEDQKEVEQGAVLRVM